MEVHDILSNNGQALVALCSGLGLSSKDEDTSPFTLAAWNKLAKQIQNSALKEPSALSGLSATELARQLSVTMDEAERIAKLLDRAGGLALELEALFSKGMWAVTRIDELYPPKLKSNLKAQAPTVLYGSGDIELLRRGGIAAVGSRNIDEAGAAFAREVGRQAASAGAVVISGGARGTDRLAMEGGLEAGGVAVGVLADSLERTVAQPDLRRILLDGNLAFVTPYVPTAGFSVGGAMGRNKIIYGLADYTVVVSSEFQTGGTWAGASEALKNGSCPVFVRDAQQAPKGNRELIKLGANAFSEKDLEELTNLPEWLQQHVRSVPVEGDLFSRQ